ncbi:MAG: hypothetical protein WC628_08900, partial [Candidatus Omnitrophota bacterium]
NLFRPDKSGNYNIWYGQRGFSVVTIYLLFFQNVAPIEIPSPLPLPQGEGNLSYFNPLPCLFFIKLLTVST